MFVYLYSSAHVSKKFCVKSFINGLYELYELKTTEHCVSNLVDYQE